MKKINYKEKKLFKMLHKYFWKHNKNNAELNSKYRTEYKTNQLNNIIKDIKYNKNKYLDIGCEECIMPISYGTACIEKALLFLFTTTALKNKTLFYFLMVIY